MARAAQIELALLKWHGLGAHPNQKAAIKLLTKSAGQGERRAIAFLAQTVYGDAHSAYHDPAQAAAWAQRASDQG